MSTKQTRSDHITKTRQAATNILKEIDALRSLRKSWDNGQGTWIVDASGSDPNASGYEANDFAGANEGLMKADISSVSTTTLDAIEALLAGGHGTNLEKIRL